MTSDEHGWPAELLPARRHQTSCHEAGHALVSLLWEVPVEHVSILPGKHFFGITFGGSDPIPDDIGYPGSALSQPRGFRDWVERQIEIRVAGPIGTQMAGPFEGRSDPTDDDFDNRAALAIARRTRHIRRLRSKKNDAKESPTDEEAALKSSRFLSWDDTPTMGNIHHVEWLREDTRKQMERHAAHFEAIAAALYEMTELTSADLDAVMASVRCGCHRWVPSCQPDWLRRG